MSENFNEQNENNQNEYGTSLHSDLLPKNPI